MKNKYFPYIALALSTFLLPVVIMGSQPGDDGYTKIPLLTLLIVSEFSFFVNAIGVYIGLKQSFSDGFTIMYTAAFAMCALLSVWFMYRGIGLWPL